VTSAALIANARCLRCGTELAPSILSCPSCRKLVHADTLARLAAEADAATRAGNATAALTSWREALDLLPPESEQSRTIAARVVELSRVAEETPSAQPQGPAWRQIGGAAGVAALVLWKSKFVVVFLLTKVKFLVLGFTKAGTAFSMVLSLGVYWAAWGWRFALGVILTMYVHEMGHVASLRRYGIAATPPMFVPGLGAFVRMKQSLQSPREDARVGLAGPIWGLGATLAVYGLHLALGWPVLAAIAKFSAWLNLFNLLPVWSLDGGRGFAALTRHQRWGAAAACGAAYLVTREGLLLLLLIAAGARAWRGDAPSKGDSVVLVQYAGLVCALALLATIRVTLPG
jgi:Zn-dependent protease